MTSRIQILIAAAFAGTLALAPVALAGGDDGARAGRGGRSHAGRHLVRGHRMQRLVEALSFSDGQKAALKDARTAAEPIRKETGEKLRALFGGVRKDGCTPDERAKHREEAKALFASARISVEPAAQRILGSLTPEQRAKLAEIAAKHGKTLDDARLLKRIERMLLMRGRRLDR